MIIVNINKKRERREICERTRKSTPIVAVASSSGNHCLSEKRSKRLLFPTDEFPMRSSLTLMSSCDCACGVGAIVVMVWKMCGIKSGGLRGRGCGVGQLSYWCLSTVLAQSGVVGAWWQRSCKWRERTSTVWPPRGPASPARHVAPP